jgi:NAD(P)-dependent dehydrogenase (short-subunit alcohol dehydrogenase family)
MPSPTFEKLQVLVTGVDAAITRDMLRLIICEGASVIAADKDRAKLARLDRDLGFFRTTVEIAWIDLSSTAEMRLWQASLNRVGRLPDVLVCCCGVGLQPVARRRGVQRSLQLSDVVLGEDHGHDCPALVAARILQPALFLHAKSLRQSAFAAIRQPTLRGVLANTPEGAAASGKIVRLRLVPPAGAEAA